MTSIETASLLRLNAPQLYAIAIDRSAAELVRARREAGEAFWRTHGDWVAAYVTAAATAWVQIELRKPPQMRASSISL